MTGKPNDCVCTATVLYQKEDKMEKQLTEMMLGVLKVLQQDKCKLVGGHTTEGIYQYFFDKYKP